MPTHARKKDGRKDMHVLLCPRACPQVSHPVVYAIYTKLPTVGPLVEQPDGHYVYGAPGQAPPQGSVARV